MVARCRHSLGRRFTDAEPGNFCAEHGQDPRAFRPAQSRTVCEKIKSPDKNFMTATPLTDELVLETLRQVIDPEIGCNIVDLGLIYRYVFQGGKLTVTMTLTTPGCPQSPRSEEHTSE